MEWKYAKVFISSSFIDMHAERDYLVKDVFPELEEWCEDHKIHLTNIDLRWGVSEDTSKNNNTIEKCLTNIDGSRPFFLCFLGQRRGWIPDFDNTLSQEIDWSNVNKLSFKYRLNDSVDSGCLSVSIGDNKIFNEEVKSNEWSNIEYDTTSFNGLMNLKFEVTYGSFNISPIFLDFVSSENPLKNSDFKEELDKKYNWDFTGDVNIIKEDNDFSYVLLNGSHISPETYKRFKHIDNYENKSATEMEIEHALLQPLKDFIEEKKEFESMHSLFFLRDKSSIKNITDAQKRIYTNYDLIHKDEFDKEEGKIKELSDETCKIIKEADDASEEIIAEIKKYEHEPNVIITDYTGEWNKNIEIPAIKALNRYKNKEWKGRLTNFTTEDEEGIKPLKEVLINQLKDQLRMEFPDNFKSESKDSELDKELNQQDIFRHLNTEGFVERLEYQNKLEEYANSGDNKICLVTADAGLGKTMLLAKFATDYKNENKDKHLYTRFCGASDLSSKTLTLWQTIISEAGISEDNNLYPKNIDDLKRNINKILEKISENGESLIIIDAVNQMSEGISMLRWLDSLPDNIKMILSVKEDKKDEHFNSQLKNIKDRSVYNHFEIKSINDKEKRDLVEKYLEGYLKELDDKQMNLICESEGSKNPLYLKVLLAELRVFASFEELQKEIESFGKLPVDAFNHVLERLEDDEKYSEGENLVPLIFSLLATARNGLSKKELIDIIKTDKNSLSLEYIRDAVNLNLRQVKPFMSRKEGRDDFFYESFKIAATIRYDDYKKYSDKLLSDYFMKDALLYVSNEIIDETYNENESWLSNKLWLFNQEVIENYHFKGKNIRSYNELAYHLNQSRQWDRLRETLSSYSFIKNKLELSDIYNLISDYQFKDFIDEKDSSKVEEHPFTKVDDHPIVLIGKALELSAPILVNEKNKNQLPIQLWGRMKDLKEDETINNLLEELEKDTTQKWLKPTTSSLYSPKSPIIKRIKPEGKESTTALVITKNKKIFIGNADGTLEFYDLDENSLETLKESEENPSKIVKIILIKDSENDEKEMFVAHSNGVITKWDVNDKSEIDDKKWKITDNENKVEITDIYYSETFNKIYASSHKGIFSINLETDEIRKEDIEYKNYNQIFVPRRNEAILVCDEKEVDGWDVYEMRKAYNQHHQHELTRDDITEGDYSTIADASSEIRFMGLVKRFLILISENGQMKMWNTLKNSGSGESIDEIIAVSPQDKFAQAVTLEDENQVITMSQMGVLRAYNIPEPRNPTFRFDKYKTKEDETSKDNTNENKNEKETSKEDKNKNIKNVQTGITNPTALAYYKDDKENWIIVGNESNDINIIDLNKPVEQTKQTHIESVLTIKINNEKMITASDNGEFFKWNITTEEKTNEYSDNFRYDCISYNQTEDKLICCGTRKEENGKTTNHQSIWKNEDKQSIEKEISNKIIDIAQNNQTIVSVDDKNLNIGDEKIELEKNIVKESINGEEIDIERGVSTLSTVYETGEVFIGFEDGRLAKYSDKLVYYDTENESKVNKIKNINNKVIVAYADGKLEIYTENLEHIKSIDAHDKAITNMHIINEDKIITVSEDKTLKIWNIESETCTYTYYLDIYATSINMKGDKIILGDSLGNVRFFKFEEEKEEKTEDPKNKYIKKEIQEETNVTKKSKEKELKNESQKNKSNKEKKISTEKTRDTASDENLSFTQQLRRDMQIQANKNNIEDSSIKQQLKHKDVKKSSQNNNTLKEDNEKNNPFDLIKNIEELNKTTNSIYDLEGNKVLIILEDGSNYTKYDDVQNTDDIIFINQDVSEENSLRDKFKEFINLKVLILQNLTNKTTSMYQMCKNCENLEIVIPIKWDTSNVNNMNSTFMNCGKLSTITHLKWDTINVTSMIQMFSGCRNLRNIQDINSWIINKSCKTKNMFKDVSPEDIPEFYSNI